MWQYGSQGVFAGDAVTTLYDKIGGTYSGRRQTEPRIGDAIMRALVGCESILNVGSGTGSYEPQLPMVVAVEPSLTMVAQRPTHSAPVVRGYAEALPFPDRSFDAVLGILTVHHWKNQAQGFRECMRVARSKVVFLTIDIDACAKFWLFDYFPELLRVDRQIFPSITQFEIAFGAIEAITVPIPEDCRDGFLAAYWKRPRAYLDPLVRASISTFSKLGNVDEQLSILERDIESGAWELRYSSLQELTAIDLGYRIVLVSREDVSRQRLDPT